MKKEYKMAKGWSIFIYLTGCLLNCIFALSLLLPPLNEKTSAEYFIFILPLSVGMSLLSIIMIREAKYGKIVITEHNISIKRTFLHRTLNYSEIKGYRIKNGCIYFVPHASNEKQIKVGLVIENQHEFGQWVTTRFEELDTTSD